MNKKSINVLYRNINNNIKEEVRDLIDKITYCGYSKENIALSLGVSDNLVILWYNGIELPTLQQFFLLKNIYISVQIVMEVINCVK